MTDSVVVVDTPFSRSRAIDNTRRQHVEATFAPDASTTDAFGRLRVSNPTTLFDAKTLFDAQPLLFDNDTIGTGSILYVQQRSSTELTSGTGTGAGNRAVRQTRRYFNYQPGKSQLVFVTFNAYGAEAGCEKRIGYFDGGNGVFLRIEGDGTVSMVQRSNVSGSVVDTVVPQSAWNRDKMDGTGPATGNPSNLDLDLTKVQIMVVDFEWLGVGVMRVGFDIDGETVYVHEFLQANLGTTVYMQTPNLPVRWEIQNTGTPGTNPKLDAICCSVQSEGGANPIATKRSIDMGITVNTGIGTTLTPLISIRLKAASNRATVFPNISNVLATLVGDWRYAVMLFPRGTGLGAATIWTSLTNSAIEYNTDRATITSPGNGIILGSGYGSSSNQAAQVAVATDIASVLALGTDIDGTTDEVVLAVQALSGTNNFIGGLGWVELL
jgi:hypothetical protein